MTDSTKIFSADAIANYFLREHGLGNLTQLQIQKLVYVSHGWHLALTKQPLIRDRIEPWKFGPVIRSLRNEFACFGPSPITAFATEPGIVDGVLQDTRPTIESEQLDYAPKIQALLMQIDKVYGKMTGPQLSTLTHQKGTPWYQVYRDKYNGNPPNGTHIPDELIESHFVSLLKNPPKEEANA